MKWLSVIFVLIIASCTKKQAVDLIVYKANLIEGEELVVDQAIAVKGERIVAIDESDAILNRFESDNQVNINARFVLPFHQLNFPLNDSVSFNTGSFSDSIATFTIVNKDARKHSFHVSSIFPIESYVKGKRVYNYYPVD